MNIVLHSRCRKCNKGLNVADLKEDENGEGMVCIDSDACKKRQAKNIGVQPGQPPA